MGMREFVQVDPVSDGVRRYRVVCVEGDALPGRVGHSHVVRVETVDTGGGRRSWTVVDLVSATRQGEGFYAVSSAGAEIDVAPDVCPRCSIVTVVATHEAGALERLPGCRS